jgi:type II secretory pathway pseudopilin PulG
MSESRIRRKHTPTNGWTLVEIMVVVSVVTVLMAILLPVLGKMRRQGRIVRGMNNQRQIVAAVNTYAVEHDEYYPESSATYTSGRNWHWQEPTMMTACKPRPGRTHRSMSAHLQPYIKNADILFCPNAPKKYEAFHEAWKAGDDWDHPRTKFSSDPLYGVYCFYWSYVGFLPGSPPPFVGPEALTRRPGQSTLLVSDYLGYDHHTRPKAYRSCEKLRNADVTAGTEVSCDFWSVPDPDRSIPPDSFALSLHAGYTDGHVSGFRASEAVPMKVSTSPDGSVPYPSGIGLGPGEFYLPADGVR